ncbi:MAG: glycoside hydrolase family 125 protein [Roseiflexaceae bacterium]|nr:glycoside hydrolase family 125 protein [Roseiflexaceae bacterium]
MMMNTSPAMPASMQAMIDHVNEHFASTPRLGQLFRNCFPNTWQTTLRQLPDDTTFVLTGDIPAMWLRDSALQVRPYLILAADDPIVADLLAGVVRRQFRYITHDPYANAFNAEPNGQGHHTDLTPMTDWLWERKYEIDSLCYPLQLAYLLWKATGRSDHLDQYFRDGAYQIIELWRREQHHTEQSDYTFVRTNCPPTDTLPNGGNGNPVAHTGMTWSGFRPSDDTCIYGYLVPSNMFAVVVLGYLNELAEHVLRDSMLAANAASLAAEIDSGIKHYALIDHPTHGTIYAYETDGMNNVILMDDANVPSLMAMPYLGYCRFDDPTYLRTRQYVLSDDNPFFYRGSAATGVGSPHTPVRYIWHIALAMQGLTSPDPAEQRRILEIMAASDAGTGFMHEGFDADDPNNYTRPWFAWANAMYAELALHICGYRVPGSPLDQQADALDRQKLV